MTQELLDDGHGDTGAEQVYRTGVAQDVGMGQAGRDIGPLSLLLEDRES